MKITDKEVLKELKRVNISELDEMMRDYPEDERDNCSDMDILAYEAIYLYDMFNEDGTAFSEDLEEAREILKETKHGKVIPLNPRTLKPKYPSYRIDGCKQTVNEYRRLGNLVKRLNEKGYH